MALRVHGTQEKKIPELQKMAINGDITEDK
jgi:hypothetical protein